MKSFEMVEVVQQVRIDAPPPRVWTALTEQTSRWWPKSFYTGAAPKAFRIDARVGGYGYEDWGDGQGFVWFAVTAVRKNELLQTVGDSDERWGGPARHLSRFELKADGDATVLRLTEHVFGHVDKEKLKTSLVSGWKLLLDDCLKNWVESGKQPEIPDTVG